VILRSKNAWDCATRHIHGELVPKSTDLGLLIRNIGYKEL